MSVWRVAYRYWLRDHAWLRAILPNTYRVDAKLFRSNHPGRRRLNALARKGVVSVLSLRGPARNTPFLLERAAADDLGLDLRFIRLRTNLLARPETLLELLQLLREMPKPMLVHCKSGADRTGLAVTLYLHVLKGVPLPEARKALSWKYAHFSWGKAGIVHAMLDAYQAAHEATGIGFEDWVRTSYDPDALTAQYRG